MELTLYGVFGMGLVYSSIPSSENLNTSNDEIDEEVCCSNIKVCNEEVLECLHWQNLNEGIGNCWETWNMDLSSSLNDPLLNCTHSNIKRRIIQH